MSKDSDKTQAKPVHRFGTGALTLAQVICFILLFLAVNYLGALHYVPKDLSSDTAFTLSSATRRYLESPAVQERKDPIRMLIAFKRNNGLYDRVRALGEEYFRLSGGKVKLELLDPVRSPDRTQQVAKEYGKAFASAFSKSMFTSDLAIIDARTAEEREAVPEQGTERLASRHVRFVESTAMASFETDLEGKRKISGFLGEDALTTGLVAAIEGKPRQIYLLADKSGYSSESADSPLMNFSGALLTQNALTEPLQIAGLAKIPDDAAAVAIINPAYDFTPQELEVLSEYWTRPKSSLLVTLGGETPPRLRAFLRNLGITPGRDRVITKRGEHVVTNVRAEFQGGMEFTRDLWEKTTTLEGETCSLDIRDKDNEDLTGRGIRPYTLLATGPNFWGETAFSTAKPEFDLREDNPGPIRLAGAVIRGAATRDDLGDQISRMVVISNSDFLSPKYFSDMNKDFLASCVNWLIGREELTGTGPRTLGTYKLPLLDSQVSFINRVNLFFLPAFALAIAAIVWSSRRA
ncbi:Gldg family protein [Luteolibacter marinus]|uniref:Gldg family protein n=1 Tax=Luteolibacter marinus TaxID=2776705 RepID=UPI001867C547|nr:Gldg family protein [Luteolibacter marinus]